MLFRLYRCLHSLVILPIPAVLNGQVDAFQTVRIDVATIVYSYPFLLVLEGKLDTCQAICSCIHTAVLSDLCAIAVLIQHPQNLVCRAAQVQQLYRIILTLLTEFVVFILEWLQTFHYTLSICNLNIVEPYYLNMVEE